MDGPLHNTTCDIYRKAIAALREDGDNSRLSEMIQTWYSRCEFAKSFDGCHIENLGVNDDGTLWIKTAQGTVIYRAEGDRWKVVIDDQLDDEGRPVTAYAMTDISEVTQTPFAYLCGARDALNVIHHRTVEGLSTKAKTLSAECRKLSAELRRKNIAVDAVIVELDEAATSDRMQSLDYPDAPIGALSWDDFRHAFRSVPGVYFAWSEGKVVYVGATQRGSFERFMQGHKQCKKSDLFSFVSMPAHEVYFAECVYIVKYKPVRNACVAESLGLKEAASRGTKRSAIPSV